MAVNVVVDNDFESKVLKSKTPVLVDFWATWCGPCKMAEPVLDELSEEFGGKVDIVKVDVDANKTIPAKYGIMSIPTTVLFKEGKEIDRQIGFAGKKAYEELLNKAL